MADFDKVRGEVRENEGSGTSCVLLAVNGTLMRGLELNGNLVKAGAEFVRETETAACYRLWSINDRHPGMIRCRTGGGAVQVELWQLPAEGLASILVSEPAGLTIGKVELAQGDRVLGVLAEPFLCEGQREITQFGGWRAYVESSRDSNTTS